MEVLQIVHTNPETGEVTVYLDEDLTQLNCRPALRLRALQMDCKSRLGPEYSVRTSIPVEVPPEDTPA